MAKKEPNPAVDRSQLTDAEKNRILKEWNNTCADYPLNICLHQLFERQAAQTPARIAVDFEGSQLTYGELNQRANQLAHQLQKFGVGPETLVGVFMERSIEMVLSLYAILKAGGAYVPVDPEYPSERVAFMLADSQVPVLLTQQRLVSALPHNDAELICLDTEWKTFSDNPTEPPLCKANADNLAYVIYTSGSTGRPKGAMNCHKAICNRLLWMQDAFQLTAADRVMQKTPFSFDVSVWEFFWPLLFGARLVVARPGGHQDSRYLVNLIVEQGITIIHFVPSMLQRFLDDPNVKCCTGLKRCICSGEALSYDLQERFFATLNAELHNLYGPTEAAVDVTHWSCEPESDLGFVPIGFPVANTQMYILDQSMRPVPVGETGELYIGGVQVGRGYLNRPELTAETFIADPFVSEPGARLYKTGDLACFLPDGAIKYLGRIDHQVKIRGVRIELGEIEYVLETHPAVKRAVVIAREDKPGDSRLVAYLVADPGQSISITQLRSWLEKELPESMIPSAYVQLQMMPLSPNGKVDRHALPAPGNKRPELDQEYVSPQNQLEKYLSEIWSEILEIDQIGIHDRFFELGGNSLIAAQFINKLQKALGENIYIVSIFEAPSISEYAAFLQKDYAESIEKNMGLRPASGAELQDHPPFQSEEKNISLKTISRMHECIPKLSPLHGDEGAVAKNPPAIFILAPPRSGTTLLRIMLAGHPDLFAASELQLLGFNTLEERQKAYSGKFSLWLEGTIRTIMGLKGCNADEAYHIMAEYERENSTTKQFYRTLQDWIGDKILVDKSPSYVLDLNTLQKAERDFDNPLYIHLIRHPYATVQSFVKYHMDQVLFLRDHCFAPHQLAELVWIVSHQNTTQFLQNIPKHRQCCVQFEKLVKDPEGNMKQLCQTLGLKYHRDLIEPYKDIDQKMTDGIYKDSKPMGDTKFHAHHDIDPKVAESWKGVLNDNFLSDITWELAISLGYKFPGSADPNGARDIHADRRQAANSRRKILDQRRRCRQRRRDLEV